jgi:hypothetical protein
MLTFAAETHQYRWDNRIVPSVTQVLQQVQDFSMVALEVLERKRQIGVALHAAIEMGDELDPDSLDELVVPFYRAWRSFMADTGYKPRLNEQPIYSVKYNYAGKPDTVGKLGRREALIDYKSAWDLHPATGPQTAAYLNGAYEMDLCDRDLPRFALQLRHNGTYRLEPLTDPNDFSVFLSMLSIYNWKKRHGIQQD